MNTPNSSVRQVGINHSFNVSLAAELKSTDLAIMVHHFQYWIQHNAVTGRNLQEGKTWTYQTLKDIAGHFVYWSIKQVERFLNRLVELKVLIKGNFNKSPYDRTVWYAFEDEEKFSISRNREIEIPESGNQDPQIGTPIPDTITNNIPDKNTPLTPKGDSAAAERAPKKSKPEIPKEATELADQFVLKIKAHKNDYVPPKKRDSWHQSAKKLIVEDKRDPEKVLRVLEWALADNDVNGDWKGWGRLVIGSKNPVEYIGRKYDSMDISMGLKKKRGFLPSSDQSSARKMANEMFRKAGYNG